jgi:diguanylate cyclase (GGDEF)-like protein
MSGRHRPASIRTRRFHTVVHATAAGAVVAASFFSSAQLDPVLLACALLICATGDLLEVAAPGRYALLPSVPAFFGAAVLLPPWAIGLLAVATFLPGLISRRGRRPVAVFNMSNFALSGLAVHAVANLGSPSGGFDRPEAVAALGAAAIVFVLVNHMLISLHAGVSAGLSVTATLLRTLRFTETAAGVPVDLGLCLTGASIVVLWHSAPWALALAAGPLCMVYVALWVPILRHRSHLDPKTGLLNLPHLRSRLERELEEARRTVRPLSVVMLDLDHLRLVNNQYGHLMGDELISAVAGVLNRATGADGFAGRFGGEEFCLVLPGLGPEQAHARAEQIRHDVEALDCLGEDGPRVHTISAGVAGFPSHGTDAMLLMAAADKALYDAKLGGRNRVRLALPEGTLRPDELLAQVAPLPTRSPDETMAATAGALAVDSPATTAAANQGM